MDIHNSQTPCLIVAAPGVRSIGTVDACVSRAARRVRSNIQQESHPVGMRAGPPHSLNARGADANDPAVQGMQAHHDSRWGSINDSHTFIGFSRAPAGVRDLPKGLPNFQPAVAQEA